MNGWGKPWRTLGKDGASESFTTRHQAMVRAREVVAETGEWCGVEQRLSTGWWLVETVEPVSA